MIFPSKSAAFTGIALAVAMLTLVVTGMRDVSGPQLIVWVASLAVVVGLAGHPRGYDFVVCVTFVLFGVNLVGLDPTDVLCPFLLVLGVLAGHLRIANLKTPLSLNLLFPLFTVFYFLSFFLGEPSVRHVSLFLMRLSLIYFMKLYIDSRRAMKLVVHSFLGGLFLVSLVGLAHGYGLFTWTLLFDPVDWRFRGLAGDPNFGALLFIFPCVWLLDELLQPAMLKRSVLAKVVGFSFFTVLIGLGGSRGGWLNLAAALVTLPLFYVLLRGASFRRFLFFGGVVLLGGVALGVTLNYGSWYQRSTANYGAWYESSYVDLLERRFELEPGELDRVEYAWRGLELASENVFGFGPGRGDFLVGGNAGRLGDHLPHKGPHNLFVEVLVDNGWVCFGVLVFILGLLLFGLFGEMLKGRGERFGLSFRVAFCVLVGMMVSALTLDLLYVRMFWFVVGMAWVMVGGGRGYWKRAAVPGGSLGKQRARNFDVTGCCPPQALNGYATTGTWGSEAG